MAQAPQVPKLVMAREVRGLNRPEFARRIVQRSKEVDGPVLGTGADGVLRWEEGRTPDEHTQRCMADVLGIDRQLVSTHPWPQWLEFDPLQHQSDHPWTCLGARDAIFETVGSDMHRRTFVLSSAAITSSLLAFLIAEPAEAQQLTGRRIGEGAVTLIERQVRSLRLADDADGGGALIAGANAGLSMVADLLSNRSFTLAHGRRLYAAAADLTRIRAWAAFDVYDRCDDQTFKSALQCAHAADDTELGAHILTFWAAAAYNCDRPADAEAMASAALTTVRGTASPRVQALVFARRARARSHLGDSACWSDLDQAQHHLQRAQETGAQEPEWAYWFDPAELAGSRASSQLTMGQPANAEQTFADAARAFAGGAVRTHALYLVRQADAQLRQGHPEQACGTAHTALDLTDEISSHRTAGPLRDLATALQHHDRVPEVRDLRERITVTLTAD
jgi:hypothetical protein